MFYLCVARIFFEITTRWPPTTDSFVAARTSRPRGRPGSSLERGRRRKEAAHRKRLSARPLFMFLFTAGQRSSGCRNSRFVATPSLKKLSFLWPSHPRPLPQWRAISGDRLQVEGLLAGAPQSGGMLVGKVLRPRQKPTGLSECGRGKNTDDDWTSRCTILEKLRITVYFVKSWDHDSLTICFSEQNKWNKMCSVLAFHSWL